MKAKEDIKSVQRFEEPKVEIEPSPPKLEKPIVQPEKPDPNEIKRKEDRDLEIQEELSKYFLIVMACKNRKRTRQNHKREPYQES